LFICWWLSCGGFDTSRASVSVQPPGSFSILLCAGKLYKEKPRVVDYATGGFFYGCLFGLGFFHEVIDVPEVLSGGGGV
jgi:hypothetical protein